MSREAWNALVDQARASDMLAVAQAHDAQLRKSGGEFVGACPVCGGHDRFAVNPRKGCFNCRVCGKGGRGPIDLEMFLGGCEFVAAVKRLTNATSLSGKRPATQKPEATQRPDEIERKKYEAKQHAKAAWLWSRRQPIAGTLAERYLRETRAIACALPPTLAFLPAKKLEHHPALISAFAICDEPEPGIVGEPQAVGAVHLTLLRPDGSDKAEIDKPKIIVGSPRARPIVVAPPNDLLGLAVCEGIEDALTAHQLTGLGAWAAGAAGFMPKLADVVPHYIEAVTIYAHPDKAGKDSARELAAALHKRGIEVVTVGI